MKLRRIYMLVGLVAMIALLSSGLMASGVVGTMSAPPAKATATPPPFPDAYKLHDTSAAAVVPGTESTNPNAISHPCSSQMVAEPPFAGLSPITIAYPRTTCTGAGQMGDIATWQYGGHDYVGLSGFGGRFYFIYNVDDPYNPVLLRDEGRPSGSTASLAIFDWTQNGNQYISVASRGSGTGCGLFGYNVNDPVNPVQVFSLRNGSDWCTVHEHFVSHDESGNADYAWITMSGENGSEGKIIALDIRNLNNIVEVNRWDRDGEAGPYFIHDSNVVRGKMYAAHWSGGMNIFDKAAFVAGGTPTPLNPIGSIQPSGFRIHHVVPTTDDRYVLIQDEFINNSSTGKVKLYDIQNLASPQFVADIIGGDPVANSQQAHNMIIKPMSSGVDLLLNAWYKAGIRGYVIDTNPTTPTITQVFRHQLNLNQTPEFGNVWGVDWLPCTLRGLERTCLYAGDMTFGLVVNAVDTNTFQPDPSLDPYNPNVPVITSPVNGQEINACQVTVTGTAHDYWSGLDRVEVSADNGATWEEATGTDNWTYIWNVSNGPGPYSLKARAFDMADNMQESLTVNITITANCPLTTPTAVPPSATATMPVITVTPSATTEPPTNTSTATNTAVASVTLTSEPSATGTTDPSATSEPSVTGTAVGSVTAEPTVTACAIVFTDVEEGSTFYDDIRCLACREIINGYTTGCDTGAPCFKPGNLVTRGQLAKIVANAAGFIEPAGAQQFADVAEGSTFFEYIWRLADREIVTGYPCGGPAEPCGDPALPYFRPNNNVTRGQISKIVAEAADLNQTPSGQQFEDVAEGSTFYEYIWRLADMGVMSGYTCGGVGEPCGDPELPYFRPAANATRGQASKIVANTFFPDCVTP